MIFTRQACTYIKSLFKGFNINCICAFRTWRDYVYWRPIKHWDQIRLQIERVVHSSCVSCGTGFWWNKHHCMVKYFPKVSVKNVYLHDINVYTVQKVLNMSYLEDLLWQKRSWPVVSNSFGFSGSSPPRRFIEEYKLNILYDFTFFTLATSNTRTINLRLLLKTELIVFDTNIDTDLGWCCCWCCCCWCCCCGCCCSWLLVSLKVK